MVEDNDQVLLFYVSVLTSVLYYFFIVALLYILKSGSVMPAALKL